MYGVLFEYRGSDKEYLIERFQSEQEAMDAKGKYVVGPGDKVFVKPLS
jgi:hypothetical protein